MADSVWEVTMNWQPPPYVVPVAGRTDGDCGIVALSTLTGVSYEDVLSLAGRTALFPHRRGMYRSQIRRVARALGL